MKDDASLLTAQLASAHGPWLRRLARGLIRDPALADDVIQEVWEVTLNQPPADRSAARTWLGRVLSNRFKNEVRSEARRAAREAAVAHGQSDQAPSPEEVSQRLALQQRLAAHVSALPPAYRQVVYLRYFEDLEPTEIAARLGEPAGTTRWRLKTALDQLRARLDDEEAGDRRRWVLLLAPLSGREPRRTLLSSPPLAGAAAILVIAASAAYFVAQSPPPPTPVSSTSGLPQDSAGKPPSLATSPPPPAGEPSAMSMVAECPEARELEAEIVRREAELERRERHSVVFERSPPNAAANASFSKVVATVLTRKARCPHSVECRGIVCRVQLLVPEDDRSYGGCFEHAPGEIEGIPGEYLDAARPSSVNSGTPTRDPLSGRSFHRYDFHYRLASLDGSPVPLAGRPPLPPIAPGRHRDWPPVAPGREPACREEAARLLRTLRTVERKGDGLLREEEAFAVNAATPALVPQVTAELKRALKLEGAAFPFAIECRGPVCAVEPRDWDAPDLSLPWRCQAVAGREHCFVDDTVPSWYRTLEEATRANAVLARSRPPRRAGMAQRPTPLYLKVWTEEERRRADPFAVLCRFAEHAQPAALVARCQEQHGPAAGVLSLRLNIPGDPEAALASGRVEIEAGGDAAASRAGDCIVRGLRAAASSFEVPEVRHGLVTYRKLAFPGARDLWADRNPCAASPEARGR
jgi:RNA polymerase sigma-70 factor (ECF subfamily)